VSRQICWKFRRNPFIEIHKMIAFILHASARNPEIFYMCALHSCWKCCMIEKCGRALRRASLEKRLVVLITVESSCSPPPWVDVFNWAAAVRMHSETNLKWSPKLYLYFILNSFKFSINCNDIIMLPFLQDRPQNLIILT